MTASSSTSVNEGAARPSGGWGCPPEQAPLTITPNAPITADVAHQRRCAINPTPRPQSPTLHTLVAASKPGSHPTLETPPVLRCASVRDDLEFRHANAVPSRVTAMSADAKARQRRAKGAQNTCISAACRPDCRGATTTSRIVAHSVTQLAFRSVLSGDRIRSESAVLAPTSCSATT